eukprot:CAMPEP_0182437348 /NCGR_PEP_ID=MMETSP1167-20130531/84986_1 /TAXON_ID=2988 /ORGANISM="Mallomonas Sp, Strain CCMP3275" /LENGTH=459 /DNA_ID=CAMNT_0024630235 /DNA_START=511 /DNA_END=1887 /DNA_ORIENTATION=-
MYKSVWKPTNYARDGYVSNIVNDTIDDTDDDVEVDETFPGLSTHHLDLASLYMIPLLESAEGELGDEIIDTEKTPLDRPKAKRRASYKLKNTNSNWSTAVALIKGMVGVFILYLPFLVSKTGIVFGTIFILMFGSLSTWSMLLLSECSDATGCQHYGEIGTEALQNPWGQRFVDISIFLSQLGFCISYYTYVSSNLLSFPLVDSVLTSHFSNICRNEIVLVCLQILLYVPLSWVRRLSRLSQTLVFANVFMVSGVLITYGYSAYNLISTEPKPVEAFNLQGSVIFLSSFVISFEGIGLVLPIKESMANKQDFSGILMKVMFGVSTVYALFAITIYLSFGANTSRFATLDLPENVIGGFVKLAYCGAIFLTYPLMLFPAIHLLERILFKGWKKSSFTTTMKNVERSVVVVLTAVVSATVSAKRFDSLISLIGSICVIPLSFVFPALFHMILCSEKGKWTW